MLVVGLLCWQSVPANMLDLVQPLKLRPSECTAGCARWADLAADGSTANQSAVDAAWAGAGPPADAGSHCAQQGASITARSFVQGNYSNGWNGTSPWSADMSLPGYMGGFCYCAEQHTTPEQTLWGYCQSPRLAPEQLNVQHGGPTTVVLAFVTFGDIDLDPPAPQAKLWPTADSPDSAKNLSGVTSIYSTDAVPYNQAGRDAWKPQPERKYSMHFVRAAGLSERTQYSEPQANQTRSRSSL